jgi:hypothetical protein
MPTDAERVTLSPVLQGHAVFLSASIPDSDRWQGRFDALEVTDAVVAAARTILTASGTLITAAHPTIAPLLLYVAAELPSREEGPSVIVYQSELFTNVLPEPTRRFGEEGVGELRWTPAIPGEAPEPGRWDESLRLMRRRMLNETEPVGAIFIGGMAGIVDEFHMFREFFPARPVYPVGRPGGEARGLAEQIDSAVPRLRDDDVYPALFRRIIDDIAGRLTT